MKDKINLLIRKLLYYYFPKRIQVFYKRVTITQEMLLNTRSGLRQKVEQEIKYGLADELFRKGIIDLKVEENPMIMATEFTGKIYVLK